MKSKAVAALAALSLMLLAAMAFLAAKAGGERYESLLLAVPVKTGGAGLDTASLEQFCEDEFLLTYEIRQEKNARAINSGNTVTVTGTNSCYQSVLGYVMTDGGFFTKAAWEAKERHAVLNETAAFRLFGSWNISGKTLRIDGETWLVTGVIRDGDEDNANIYAPSGVTGGRPQSVMALTGGGVTATYAKNALKSLGIHDAAYEFYDLSKLASLYGGRFAAAWKSAAFLTAVIVTVMAALGTASRSRAIKARLKDQYLTELAAKNRRDLLKTAGWALLAITGAATALVLSVQILEACLGWTGLAQVDATVSDFAQRLKWLRDYHAAGIILFAAFECAAVLLFALACRNLTRAQRG